MLTVPSAAAVDVSLSVVEGPDVDLWITPSAEVQSSELAIVVNYGDEDLILKMTGNEPVQGNKTYVTQVIEARNSAWVELTFLDVDTRYWITITREGEVVLEISKARPNYLVMPPDNNWIITQPDEEDEDLTIYTQDWVDNLVSSITLELIAVTTLISVIGAFIGAGVKQLTRFLCPWDLVSMIVYAFVVLDSVFMITGEWDRLWYLPFMAGYWIGFMLWHIPYRLPIKIDSESKSMSVRPIVLYYPEDKNKPCVQEQTNRALIRRLLGIHHELKSNGSLEPDWYVDVKRPYFPAVKGAAIWIQKTITDEEEVERFRINWAKRSTRLILANASRMPYFLWLQTSKAFYELSDRLEYSENERIKLQLTRAAEATRKAADLISHSQQVSWHEDIGMFAAAMPDPTEVDIGEHVLNVPEKVSTDESESEETDTYKEKDEDAAEAKETSPEVKQAAKQNKGRKGTKGKGGKR
jgi:hypothetical protein